MWILPVDLSQVRVTLPPGQYLLPWHYTGEEIRRLAWLLRGTLPDIKDELHLTDATLRAVARRAIQARDALVIATVEALDVTLADALDRLRGLGARYALLRCPVPQESGYAWLEQHVKVPVLSALRTWLRRPEHPLAPLGIHHLPLLDAASLTTDPVELIDLLERTVSHRMEHADVGVREDDYLRSLHLSAGRRLAERLMRLSDAERPRALEMILANAKAKTGNASTFHPLQRVGLAQIVGDSVSLGPLPRSIAEPRILGALEAAIPERAWTESSFMLLRRLRSDHEIRLPDIPDGVAVATSALGGVPFPVELLAEPAGRAFSDDATARSVVDLLAELGSLPWFTEEVPREIEERLTQALLWLEDAQRGASEEARWSARGLEALLRLFAARGPTAIERQASALALLNEALERLGEAWPQSIHAAATLHHAGFRVERARSREDVDRAEALLLACVATLEVEADPAAQRLLAATYLRLADIAAMRGAQERALEWDERARLSAQGVEYGPLRIDIELAHGRDALWQRRFSIAEQHALLAHDSSLRTRDRWRLAASSRLLARLRRTTGDLAAAHVSAEEAISVADEIGDLKGRIEGRLVLAEIDSAAGDFDACRRSAEEALRLSESVEWHALRASAYILLGSVAFQRKDMDELNKLLQKAAENLDRLGMTAVARFYRQMADQWTQHLSSPPQTREDAG
ncbi:MAG: hypothetical protein IT372_36835 [Polyangiaceae bacterium]|nr:hypothetical protein [Polyangiaceae bacterium]